MPYLPQEIITDTLTLLPAKTLIKFKRVSKSWLNLISDPDFINNHVLNSYKSDNFSHQRLLIAHRCILPSPIRHSSFHLKSYSLDSIFSSHSDDANSNNAYNVGVHWNKIVGSCNGLVCVAIRNASIFIWNPCTGVSKTVVAKSFLRTMFICYGFGYDHVNDDYKVVRIEYSGTHMGTREAGVYSLRTNSWRKIGDFPHSKPLSNPGQFVNGVLHWLARSTPGVVPSLVTLDLENEIYGEIAQPNYGDGGFNIILAVLQGCLSVCCNFISSYADIWVMKEYGARDSWIKMYTMPYMPLPDNFYPNHYSPVSIYTTGEILLEFQLNFFLYDPNYGFRRPKIPYFPRPLESVEKATAYVESLVSPYMYDMV